MAKIEKIRINKNSYVNQEYKWYNQIGGDYVPRPHYLFKGLYRALIMQKLGLSLQNAAKNRQWILPIRTICRVGIELIKGIKSIHSKGVLHRDIKPANICLGYGDDDPATSPIYLVDLGLVKEYILPNGAHIPPKEGKGLTGTAKYCSVFTHEGYE